MSDKNVILLIIDNLRFDSFDNLRVSEKFFPNFLYLIRKGFMTRIISNSHATKFVMPPLFTQTFPLDYDGYNQTIKKRPASFVELLKKNKYSTFMLQGDDNDGPENLCERGFDYVESLYDRRLLVQNYIEEVIKYELDKNDKSIEKDILVRLRKILTHMANSKNRIRRRNLPAQLQVISKKDKQNYEKEINLIDSNPDLIIFKLRNVEPHLYYLTLGKKNINNLSFLFKKFFFSLLSLFEKISLRLKISPFKFLTFRKTPFADEILFSAKNIFKEKNFFIYAHLMDLHDRRVANRFLKTIKKILFFPYWLTRRRDLSFKRFLYDTSLSFIDKNIGKLICDLKKIDKFKNTKIIISADHGTDISEKQLRNQNEIFGFRTHSEYIDVPLIYYNSSKKIKNAGLFDSMSISATILDDLGIKPHESFKGKSLFVRGNEQIISENADRGNCDLLKKNLYFTVTCESFKGMFYIQKNKMIIKGLYNIKADPLELNNVVNDSSLAIILKKKLNHLFRKRAEIIKKRKVSKNKIFLNNKTFPIY